MRHALLFSVFVIASCGLAYELIAAGAMVAASANERRTEVIRP